MLISATMVHGREGLLFLAGLFLSLSSCSSADEPVQPALATIDVEAVAADRANSTIQVADLPAPVQEPIHLLETTQGLAIPTACQLDPTDGSKLYFEVSGSTMQGGKRTYRLLPGADDTRPALPAARDDGKTLQLFLRGKEVLQYNYGLVSPPTQDIDPIQARDAYIHPVLTPAGRVVTDDFHPEHLHQRGIFMAWTKTEFNGRTPDFWNLGEGTGTARFKEFRKVFQGPVFAGFQAVQEHVDLSAPGGAEVALTELWDVRLWRLGLGEGYFIFDLDSVQQCATDAPLILPEYHYGGMGFRGARGWTPDVLRVETSARKDRTSGDGSRADWCRFEGPVDGHLAGVVVFGDPQNFRAPQPLRIHPEMPYFAFSPVRLGEMKIAPGQPYHSRFRFLAYDGSMKDEVVQSHWLDFTTPMKVTVRTEGE